MRVARWCRIGALGVGFTPRAFVILGLVMPLAYGDRVHELPLNPTRRLIVALVSQAALALPPGENPVGVCLGVAATWASTR